MTTRDSLHSDILTVIPDILIWFSDKGYLIDFHPNNHAFLFDHENGVIGLHLNDIFNEELTRQLLHLAQRCRVKGTAQNGRIQFHTDEEILHFECRVTAINHIEFLAAWREIPVMPETGQRTLIRGNNQATLVLLTDPSLDDAIIRAFAILGEHYQSDRIFLFRNHSDPESGEPSPELQFEWSASDVPSCIDNPLLCYIEDDTALSDLYLSLKNNSPVIALADDVFGGTRELLERMEIRSVILMPVFVRHTLWGFLGMGDCHTEKIWSEEEVSAFHTVSVVLGSVIQKHQDQEELTIARLRAEESDRLKSSILANINHEFRTPMTGILGFSEILFEEAKEPHIRNMAENILLSGKRLLSTLNSMIELSQFEARKTLYKLVETKLNELILLACEPHFLSAQKKQLQFDICMSESIFSYVEEKLFTQLLDHIIGNAVKFTVQGKITVETKTIWEEERSWSCILVSDTGPGIPGEYHKIIFEEFRQVSEGYNRSFEGNGLGLTLSQKIIALMNGKLTLKSESGKGCTFTIWLPSSQATAPYPETTVADPVMLEDAPPIMPPSLPVSSTPGILIVEDNKLNAELIQIYLRKTCHCDIARNGEDAIELAATHSYRAILMDINLGPGIDGMEATRRIRTLPRHKETPVIAVTGYTLDSDKEEIMEAGCTHYLPKPIGRDMLIELITPYINHT